MNNYNTTLQNALNADDVFNALYKTAVSMKNEGLSKDEVYAEFEALQVEHAQEENETIYNAILDVMDCIVGYCSSDKKIFP